MYNSFNFIYIDGSHKCLDVYFDAMIAWKLLKIGGIMAFDDYLFNKGDILNTPYDAVNYFLETIKGRYILLDKGYRLFIKKIN
jgi:predicted O-methyltransferase YrrM